MLKKIIYSALVGDYDLFPEHFVLENEDWEHVLFTDVKFDAKVVNGWKIKPLFHHIKDENVKTARWHKLNSHLLFDDCIFSIWIDSNVKILDNYIYQRSQDLFDEKVIMASVKHPERDCIYDEAKECLILGKDKKDNINSLVNFLNKEKYPRQQGLFESNLLFRNHNHEQTKEFNELWWNYLNKYSRRDQLTMCYILWKNNFSCSFFFEDENITTRNSTHFLYSQNHKIQNDYIEISKQEILNRDTQIHEKNLEIISNQNLLAKKNHLLNQKEAENQHHINLYNQKKAENQHHINLLHQKEVENQHHINLLHQKEAENQLLTKKIKRIKRTISYKVFFKIEIFFKELFQRLFL